MAEKAPEKEQRQLDREAELARQDAVIKAVDKHNAETYAQAQKDLAATEKRDKG